MSKPIDQERADFEAWYAKYVGVTPERVKSWREGDSYGEWYTGAVNAWVTWQARAAVQPAGVAVPSPAEYGEAVKRLFELDADAKKYCAEHWLLTIFKWTVGRVCEINSVAVQHPVSGEQKPIEMADIVKALESVAGAPILTSNMCYAIAQAINAHRAQQGEQP